MARDYEAVVLGLGGIGSAALYWLARRLGDRVLGIEQFEPGHRRGGSQDHHRIIRYSYHSPVYVRLAEDAYRSWSEVEAEAGEDLVVRTGGLDLFPPGGSIPLGDYTGSLETCGVPFELLDARGLARWCPPFRLPDETVGLYQEAGGLVLAANANAAHLRLARQRGARVLTSAPVTAIRPLAGEFEVEAGGAAVRCRRLVIAAGAWTGKALASFGLELPLTVTQEQVTYFPAARREEFSPRRFPIWIWMDEPCFYGFPWHDPDGVKVAQDVGGREVTAESRSFEPDPDALARVEGFCRSYLPGALGPPSYTRTCLYTLTPDRDFIVDRLPGHPGCTVAVGAGHAFKFASLLGKLLARMALDEPPGHDLSPFRIERPILAEKDPPRSFMLQDSPRSDGSSRRRATPPAVPSPDPGDGSPPGRR